MFGKTYLSHTLGIQLVPRGVVSPHNVPFILAKPGTRVKIISSIIIRSDREAYVDDKRWFRTKRRLRNPFVKLKTKRLINAGARFSAIVPTAT